MDKQFSKVRWLEELARKYEVPVEQVMLVWSVFEVTCNIGEIPSTMWRFELVLGEVFVN